MEVKVHTFCDSAVKKVRSDDPTLITETMLRCVNGTLGRPNFFNNNLLSQQY